MPRLLVDFIHHGACKSKNGKYLTLPLYHSPYHLIMLRHCMPGHLCTLGNHTVIRLVWVEPHIFPDLPLLLGELIRRDDPMHPVQDGLSLRVHLPDQHLQLCLALLPGVGVDTFGMLCTVRPGGGVATLEEVVIELVDASSAGLSDAPHDRLEVGQGILRCLRSVLRYFVAQAPVDLGGGFAEHVAGDVGVDVQRGCRRYVAQHGGEGFDVHAVLQRHGGESVAQIMEADLFALGPLQRHMEAPEHGAGGERRILLDGRGEYPAAFGCFLILPEYFDHCRRKYQLADGRLGFGDAYLHSSVYFIDLLGHRQCPGIQIQVGPLQGQQFSPAQSRGQVQQEQFEVSICLGLHEKPLEFLAGQHLHLLPALRRQFAAYCRVGPDQVFLHHLIQGRPAFGVAHPHHPVGETLAVEIGADEPPLFFQVGIELLEILLGQLAQRDLAQLRNDVLVDVGLIGVLRGGAETGLDVGLIPEVHPFPEGHVGTNLFGLGVAYRLHQLGELFLTLMVAFGQHVFRFGQALVIVSHHGAAFPTAVLALPYGAGSAFSFPCHGFNSSPSKSFRKPPTTSLAAFCMSGVTWV